MAESESESEKKDAAPADPALPAPANSPVPTDPTSPSNPANPASPVTGAAPVAAAKKELSPRKKWAPQPPAANDKWVWRLVFFATFIAVALLGVIVLLLVNTKQADDTPKLAEEYKDPVNTYAIRPPVNWLLQDPHDGRRFFIKGPKETGYIPMIEIYVDVAPGHLDSYMKEYQARELATAKVAPETREKFGGYDVSRIVFTWDTTTDDSQHKPVTVKTVQYIVEDSPRFYRIICSVREDMFDAYLPRFEAAAKSFRILPLNPTQTNVIPPGQ